MKQKATDRDNLSTRHQQPGDARHPQDTLDRDQPREGAAGTTDKGRGAGHGEAGEDYDDDAPGGSGKRDARPEVRGTKPPTGPTQNRPDRGGGQGGLGKARGDANR